jgi:hypothetical protein
MRTLAKFIGESHTLETGQVYLVRLTNGKSLTEIQIEIDDSWWGKYDSYQEVEKQWEIFL